MISDEGQQYLVHFITIKSGGGALEKSLFFPYLAAISQFYYFCNFIVVVDSHALEYIYRKQYPQCSCRHTNVIIERTRSACTVAARTLKIIKAVHFLRLFLLSN